MFQRCWRLMLAEKHQHTPQRMTTNRPKYLASCSWKKLPIQ
jgi:hypothetical protein